MPDLALRLLISAQSGNATSVLYGLSQSLSRINGPAAIAATAVMAVGIAAVGVGVAATKMAADYQQGMNMVQSLTGASDSQMKQYDSGLKALAIDAGVAPKELTTGLYNVLSAGFKSADAMKVLTLATEDAKIGMTDAGTTTAALTRVLKTFEVGTGDFTRVNGEMLQTVTLGHMTMQQYAGSIGKASTVSMQFHVSMEQMNASLATLTANGIPSAAQAVTDYNQVVKVMYGNIDTVVKSLHKNGIAFDEAKFNALDYTGKIKMLGDAVQLADDKHKHITGVTQQAAAALQILSGHSVEYTRDLALLSNQQSNANKTAEAWKITQSGFNQQMDRAKAAIDVLLISIGAQLLPVLTKFMQQMVPLIAQFQQWIEQNHVVEKVMGAIIPLLTGFINGIIGISTVIGTVIGFFQRNEVALTALKAALIAISAVITMMVIEAFVGMAVAAGAAVIAALPVIAVIAALTLVIFGIIEVVQHWGNIMDWLSGKSEQMRIKVEQQHTQMAITTDQQTAKGAQAALNNLEKERVGIIAKLQQTHDAATRMELQHQLDMTNRDIEGQQVRLKNADADAAKQKAHLAQLHADLLESQKSANQRFDDMANAWISHQVGIFTTWKDQLDGKFRQMASDTTGTINSWIGQQDEKFRQWVSDGVAAAQSLVSGVVHWFQQLPGQLFSLGQSAIQGFIGGIQSMMGSVSSTMQGFASTVAKFLPHSPADTGPLSDPALYGPGLVNSLSKGIAAGAPQASAAMAGMTGQVASAMKIAPGGVSSASGGGGGGGGGQVFNITINAPNADAKAIYDLVVKNLTQDLQRSGLLATTTSGGKRV